MVAFDVVVPTLGRPSLRTLLSALAASPSELPGRVVLVHDVGRAPEVSAAEGLDVELLRGPGRGPAAARNVGWRAATADWIAFLDDDVVPEPGWARRLADDLAGLPADVAGSQGRVRVPLPSDRRPTDWERNIGDLERARWATADMAYRRALLAEVGGFDERFERAYREDADLALRMEAAGYRLVRGRRSVTHPVPPADRWVSLRLQAGNADDVLMEALHPGWRSRPGEPKGRRRRHLAVTAAGLAAVGGLAFGKRRIGLAASLGWLAGTAELVWARIAPGPRTRDEVSTMLLTSAALPALASAHWVAGLARRRSRLADRARAPRPASRNGRPAAVLLDRDGTLIVDVPYNGDPDNVVAVPGAREALDRLRAAGIPLAVVSNQSGIGRGLVTRDDVEAVNRRVEDLLGPLGRWFFCPHAPGDGCGCRKPEAGLVLEAAAALGVDPRECALVGDIGSDVEAATAAGARAILVPTARTRPEETRAAPEVARDLGEAVDVLLRGAP